MLGWKEIYIQQEQKNDWLRQAERERLARIARYGLRGNSRRYAPALAWLGSRLIAWGQHLQTEYSYREYGYDGAQ